MPRCWLVVHFCHCRKIPIDVLQAMIMRPPGGSAGIAIKRHMKLLAMARWYDLASTSKEPLNK